MDKPVAPSRGSNDDAGPLRSELLQRTVHDLKNPLAVVQSALEWLAVELGDRADALDAIRDASTATSRLVAIVDDLHSLARLDRAGLVSHGPTDIAALVRSVAGAAAIRLIARGLTFVSTVPASAIVEGDADLLAQSLHAIVDACARGAPAGTSLEIVVRMSADDAPAEVEIEVGQVGTAPAGPETSSLDALSSAGIRVYVALQIVRAHGGSLKVIPTATMPRALMRLPR
jgi:signal transduction histidine kinase